MMSFDWAQMKAVIDDKRLACQMCGAATGDVDELTGRGVRLVLGGVIVESLGSIEGLPKVQVLCSSCKRGAKNITGEKPTAIWLLSQVRRTGEDEQRAVFDWLQKKFARKS